MQGNIKLLAVTFAAVAIGLFMIQFIFASPYPDLSHQIHQEVSNGP